MRVLSVFLIALFVPVSVWAAPWSYRRISRRSLHSNIRNIAVKKASTRRTVPAASSAARAKQPTVDASNDLQIRSQFVLLGNVTPVLASVKIYPLTEPLEVDRITVELAQPSHSVASILIYESATGRFLGRATLDNTDTFNTTFWTAIPTSALTVGQKEERSMYVRAVLKSRNEGGQTGEVIQVGSITVRGNGAWSNTTYTKTSTESFVGSHAANGRITKVERTREEKNVLIPGSAQRVGSFRFTGEEGDGEADVRLTSLTFQIEQAGDVTLSNAYLQREGGTEHFPCTVSTGLVTCSGITGSFGVLDGVPEFFVYADVAVPQSSTNAFLRLSLNQPGDVTGTSGAISWTDGDVTFSWVPFDAPVARGVILSR